MGLKAALRGGHQLSLLEGGQQLFPALVRAMDAAQRLVHVETYIFEFAGEALGVAEALERAARRGVTVRLVVDGVGTPRLPREWRERFRAAGVQWRTYSPFGTLGLLIPSRWRRLHRKLCVVDGALGFCGGINLIDDLDDLALGRLDRPRLDYAMQVSGPLVSDMLETMEQLWWRMLAARRVREHEFRAAWAALRAGLPAALHLGHGGEQADAVPRGRRRGQAAALLLRDNVRHRHAIERAYLRAIALARHEIVIANAYFIPGRRLRRALSLAAERGVRVRLLLQGRYEHFLQFHAAKTVVQWLVDAGVEVHEYAPSALHAKVAVIDRRWATVGSTNLDPLSLLLAREANVVTTDGAFARELHHRLEHLMQTAAHRVDAQQLRQRPWGQRVRDRIAFAVMRTVLYLTGKRY
jgi:cardiolipin synthase A/B